MRDAVAGCCGATRSHASTMASRGLALVVFLAKSSPCRHLAVRSSHAAAQNPKSPHDLTLSRLAAIPCKLKQRSRPLWF
ncbi:hypothetical protein B0T26DRAFT_703961 [Lasiosphaeria miniovina]|uniref:Uncharacterized protein n=1 Tax=Lasiosphaeria miniovina TaxID=1954250 RepID=A0AA40AVN0_9PEZI|nr:uncharacterized protein B0T26DRAFT_703961 [Lasiosphaeria miniovina]KAK0722783.1 hypothetical protein B0T26DRAFT_703961 [Lasiosphaeria miniovina]